MTKLGNLLGPPMLAQQHIAPTVPPSAASYSAPLPLSWREGVAEAAQIRDSIMSHVNVATTAGLGDEPHESTEKQPQWSAKHIDMLREIRDLAEQL